MKNIILNLKKISGISNPLFSGLTALALVGQLVLPMVTSAIGPSAPDPAPNPSLVQSCGLDIALVLDSSGSISPSELNQMKNAFKIFVNVFLPETPTQFSVTDFDTTATVKQLFTSDETSINSAINLVTSYGATNWEDGLLKAQSTFDPRPENPNLVIFASDGNPNKYNPNEGPGYGFSQVALNQAILAANDIKNSGIRIIALGIGDNLSVANLEKISSANAVYTSNFEDLAEDLSDLASQLCGGTITARKIIDADGDIQTTGDQTPGASWNFDVAGSPETTDQDGYTTPVSVLNGTYSVSETLQGGYSFIDASCSGADSNGTLSGNTISGIEVSTNNIVSCVFYNQLTCTDNDGDSFAIEGDQCGPVDCDDTNAAIYPGATELCNGIDDNCDQQIDQGFNVGETCTVGLGVCQATGQYVCTVDGLGTECNAVPGTPGEELCNDDQLDEDCDGEINEGCECIDGTTQQCGLTDVGLCEYGTQTCSGGVWGCCEGAVYPAEEICGNDLDEDCDGSDLPCPCLTVNAYKIVCQSESDDLPDWGNGGSNITANTAADYVAQHPNCHFESGWNFQWHFGSSNSPGNPGDNIGDAGGSWTTFGPTDSNGLAATDICSLSDYVCDDRIWVREVTQEGYVPFSGDNTIPRDDDVSAEFYCHTDVLNYDNYDFILNPQFGNTYYCVAFNAPPVGPTTYTVTFDGNGGTPETQTETVEEGQTVDPLPTVTREGFNFIRWNTQSDGNGDDFTTATPVIGDITVYAIWEEIPLTYYTVTFMDGETTYATRTVEDGHFLGEDMPSNPTKEGYTFVGWNTQPDRSGSSFTSGTVVTGDITVYAMWREIEEVIEGCTDPVASNYNPEATVNDGSCTYPEESVYGCTDPMATNYDPDATANDGSCTYGGSPIGGQLITPPGQVLGEEIVEPCGIYLYEYIQYGADNNPEEVKKLQIFLNQHMGSNLPITGVYDLATMNVVNQFQVQCKEEVLRPWVDDAGTHCDVSQPTGYVYKTTQRWINLIMCPTLNLPMPDLSDYYPKADCAGYWGEVLGEEIVTEEDGMSEDEFEEFEEPMPEEEEGIMPLEIEEIVTEAPEEEERGTSVLWLTIIIVLIAAVAIWFVYKGVKK